MTTSERIRAILSETPDSDPDEIARVLIDQDVSAGEYEGCSSELELAYVEYAASAREVLDHEERARANGRRREQGRLRAAHNQRLHDGGA